MSMHQSELSVRTRGRGLLDITREVADVVADAGVRTGICHVFIRHTSASLVITENADPDVHRDLETFIGDLVPDGDPRYVHRAEGPDDMPAHVRSVLTQTHLSVPVTGGQLALGTWQGIYLWEHRKRGHERRVLVTIEG